MKVAITGGAGFIGSACVRQLEKLGHTPIVLDKRDGFDVNECSNLQADAVIHLAGVLGTTELYEEPDYAIDVNVKGTLRVLEACRVSGAAYVGITMPDVWANIYQATKIAAQRIALGFYRDFGVPVTHIRAFNAYGAGQKYGPGHPQKIIPTFATKAWLGECLPIWGDGEQTVDLVHVDHVAACLVDAALHSRPRNGLYYGQGQVYDAGSGVEVSVLDVARLVCDAIGAPCRVEFWPMRAGETPDTKLCATEPGPMKYDERRLDHELEQVVLSYRP